MLQEMDHLSDLRCIDRDRSTPGRM